MVTAKDKLRVLEERLASGGHRLTPQRVLILEALRRHKSTVTAPELYDELRAERPDIGRATVFRNLDALVEIGLARRFERSGHVYAYASCSPEHHHHLICSTCHRATEIAEELVAPLISVVREGYGFEVEHDAFDVYGTCASCRRAAGGRR